jgi:hypothetical protein
LKTHSIPLGLFSIGVAVLLLCGSSSSQKQDSGDSNGFAVKGNVSWPHNKPVRSVWVVISKDGQEITRALTGDDGKYYFKTLSSGTYDLSVKKGKSDLCRRQLDLPSDLQKGNLLNIKVKSLKGKKTRTPRCE